MKAVILVGDGPGRLEPICAGGAEAGVSVVGQRVLERHVRTLEEQGIRDIRVTEEPWPEAGTGDGEELVLVRADGLFDFDLARLLDFHRQHRARATLALCSAPGTRTDAEGRVTGLGQRPGVAVLAPGCLWAMSPGPVDPDRGVYGWQGEGSWRRLDSCRDYLDRCEDILSGRLRLDMGLEQVRRGIWSAGPLPEGVEFIPPCWIGPEVDLGRGSLIGPHVVLERGSRVGRRSLVQRSVLLGARVGDRATLYGAVLCKDARAGDETVLNRGTVLGAGVRVEERGVLLEGVRLWPGVTVPRGCRQSWSVTGPGHGGGLELDEGGAVRDLLGEKPGPDQLRALGRALGRRGKVALGSVGGTQPQRLLGHALEGVVAGGGTALRHGMRCPAQAAWLARYCTLPASLFVSGTAGEVQVHLFDSRGLPLSPEGRRRLEEELAARPGRSVGTGEQGWLPLGPEDYARDTGRQS